MTKINDERQKAYRLRRNEGEGDRRLNTWITSNADLALDRLAKHYGVTKRQMIERLACEADDTILKSLDDTGADNYIEAPLRRNQGKS